MLEGHLERQLLKGLLNWFLEGLQKGLLEGHSEGGRPGTLVRVILQYSGRSTGLSDYFCSEEANERVRMVERWLDYLSVLLKSGGFHSFIVVIFSRLTVSPLFCHCFPYPLFYTPLDKQPLHRHCQRNVDFWNWKIRIILKHKLFVTLYYLRRERERLLVGSFINLNLFIYNYRIVWNVTFLTKSSENRGTKPLLCECPM